MTGTIVHTLEHGIGSVTISHPGKRNAVSVAMWKGLKDTFESLSKRDDVRCIVIRGEGTEAFAAGADISEFEAMRSTRAQVERYHEQYVWGGLAAIANCPIPIVALINGACVGGGLEIASACDLRIAGESSRFGVPINRLGFPLAYSEMQSLMRLVGRAVAAELLLEGRIYGAWEAYEKGLVTRVVGDEALADEAYAAARRIADGAPLVARTHKRQIRRLAEDAAPLSRDERLAIYAFADTEDYRIGYRAFQNKERPRFVGR